MNLSQKTQIRILKGLVVVGAVGAAIDLVIMHKQHTSIMRLCKAIDERNEHIKDCYRYSTAIMGVMRPDENDLWNINRSFDFMKWQSEVTNP